VISGSIEARAGRLDRRGVSPQAEALTEIHFMTGLIYLGMFVDRARCVVPTTRGRSWTRTGDRVR